MTVDADTFVTSDGLRFLVSRLLRHRPNCAAAAGHLLAANPKDSWIARIQAWDYRMAITAIKKTQGMQGSTLVAQGAFSAYKSDAVREASGWKQVVGEDIVLSWEMLSRYGPIAFEDRAVAYTVMPTSFVQLFQQRRRWARGMFEAFRQVDWSSYPKKRTRYMVAVDLLIPWMDVAFTLIWIPGLLMALGGYYLLAGPLTLFVVPMSALLFGLMDRKINHEIRVLHLQKRRDIWGFACYILCFQLIQSPAALMGYLDELRQRRKRW